MHVALVTRHVGYLSLVSVDSTGASRCTAVRYMYRLEVRAHREKHFVHVETASGCRWAVKALRTRESAVVSTLPAQPFWAGAPAYGFPRMTAGCDEVSIEEATVKWTSMRGDDCRVWGVDPGYASSRMESSGLGYGTSRLFVRSQAVLI